MRIANRRAYHDYFILETFEAGIALAGSEVKSLRLGRANLQESFVKTLNDGLYLVNCHIPPFQGSLSYNDPDRARKLLLHKKEILRISNFNTQKGVVVVPLAIYFKNNLIKVYIALAKPKKQADKRLALKKRAIERDIQKTIKAKIN